MFQLLLYRNILSNRVGLFLFVLRKITFRVVLFRQSCSFMLFFREY
jgi:hypothetical protein